jgi:xylitol oxidase
VRPRLHVSEVRTIAADELWLSMNNHRDSMAIHFTWRLEPDGVGALLPELERALTPFAPRPHWGKLFAADAATLAGRYDRLADFARLQRRLDPRGAFRTPWLVRRVLGGQVSDRACSPAG